MGQKGLVLFGDAHSGVRSRNKVNLYLLGRVFFNRPKTGEATKNYRRIWMLKKSLLAV